MADTYISESAAMRVLQQEGDYSATQAKTILNHSLKQTFDGVTYYPMSYVYKRAKR
jgi:hypothetical protein